jgi:hypothetical protein
MNIHLHTLHEYHEKCVRVASALRALPASSNYLFMLYLGAIKAQTLTILSPLRLPISPSGRRVSLPDFMLIDERTHRYPAPVPDAMEKQLVIA